MIDLHRVACLQSAVSKLDAGAYHVGTVGIISVELSFSFFSKSRRL